MSRAMYYRPLLKTDSVTALRNRTEGWDFPAYERGSIEFYEFIQDVKSPVIDSKQTKPCVGVVFAMDMNAKPPTPIADIPEGFVDDIPAIRDILFPPKQERKNKK